MGRYITPAEFAAVSTLSRSTIYAMKGRPGTPTPIPVSERRWAYDEDEVTAYLERLKADAQAHRVAS